MSAYPSARAERLSALREEVRAIGATASGAARAVLPFGLETLDARLADGGLATGGLHEIAGATCAIADDAAATLFVAGIAARAGGARANMLWAFGRRDLFAPGLAQAGLGPNRLIHAEAGRDPDILAVMEEGLRHGGLCAVIGEVGRIGMTATRRLQLAAEEGGTIALLLRRWRPRSSAADADPLTEPSAATTRWRIACAPSEPLPVPGVGRPRWHVDLVRQRGGEPFSCILGGCDAEGRLALPTESRDRSPAPRRRRRAA
ncbi:ImuA family protein [Sphingomonas profundi]|uniref:ImuA family protein n=1 Tax=Alterirhizorhabdus profundi TaxID=2681549 RepID=UPI001E542BA3|nr:protein ImuA [Sphingomonas profundi]